MEEAKVEVEEKEGRVLRKVMRQRDYSREIQGGVSSGGISGTSDGF